MKIAVISLSNEGARIAARLAERWDACELFLHESVNEVPLSRWTGEGLGVRGSGEQTAEETALTPGPSPVQRERGDRVSDPNSVSDPKRVSDPIHVVYAGEYKRFERLVELTSELFPLMEGLVYIAPIGAVVRAIAPCLRHKTTDPAVVAVDVGGRWAVSLLSGHEGGANDLALEVANILGAEPVISTTTEAVKNLVVGVGCRRGTPGATIIAAVREALVMAGCELSRVRLLATAEVKAHESGLLEASRELCLPLRLVPDEEIRHTVYSFAHSAFVQEKVELPAVAEPAALLAGRRTQLLLPRQIFHGVTVAIARENCTSLA